MTTPPNPAIVREITTKINAGWTVVVAGTCVLCTAPNDATLSVDCGTVEDAVGLLAAAKGA